MRVGIGGPVGSGKTMLVWRLCERLRGELSLAVITNDIYTREDSEFLLRQDALPAERVIGVETGGCPHTAIRDDTSMNMGAVAELERRHGADRLQVILIESGPAIRYSDLLVINKIELAPHVGADLGVMERDARLMRGEGRPFLFCDLKSGRGLDDVVGWLRREYLFGV